MDAIARFFCALPVDMLNDDASTLLRAYLPRTRVIVTSLRDSLMCVSAFAALFRARPSVRSHDDVSRARAIMADSLRGEMFLEKSGQTDTRTVLSKN